MKKNDDADILLTLVVVIVVAPIVIGGVIEVLNMGINGANYILNKIEFKKRIKKGLKDGSICEINGEYYEVKDVEKA